MRQCRQPGVGQSSGSACLTARPALCKLRKHRLTPSDGFKEGGSDAEAGDPAEVIKDKDPAKKRRAFSHALNSNFGTEELMEELSDRQSFGKRGELVLVAQVVCMMLVLVPPMRLQGIIYLMGILSLLTGVIAVFFTLISLGRSFSPLIAPRNNNELVTTGMYQYMRHPLYAGILALGFGLAAVTYNETRLVICLLLYLILNYKAQQEEAALCERHGAAYETYMQKVGRFFPAL